MANLIDRSNNAPVVAEIRLTDDKWLYRYSAQDERAIADFLYQRIGERLCDSNNIPLYIEASAWCTLASVGEMYEDESFVIEILEREG